MTYFRVLAAGIGLQLMVGAVLADVGAPALAEARRLLAAGQAAQAVSLLEDDLLRSAGNADYDYLLGLAYHQSGKAGEALFAFERVAMVDPGNADARLKAARINLERGETASAKELLAPLSKQKLGAGLQQEMERLRTGIASAARAEGVALSGHVLAGIGWDDNVTSGPNQSALVIPNQGPTPLALGSAARDHDSVGMVEAGLSLRQALDDDTWLTGGGSLRQGFNRARKDVKEGAVNLDLGVLRRSGDDFLGATLLAQDYLVSDTVYRKSLGARLNWIRPLAAQSRLNGYFQHLDFDFPDHAIDNAVRQLVGVTHEGVAEGSGAPWQYGFYGGKETARDPTKPHFSFRLWGAHLGGSLSVNDRLSLSGGVVYEAHRHLAEDALYLVTRRDATRSVGIAADYKLDERWHLLSRYTYTRNGSNTALYDYSRNIFTLQLRWDFDHAKN